MPLLCYYLITEDFISTAECLKIDGLAAEDPGSFREDVKNSLKIFYCSKNSLPI